MCSFVRVQIGSSHVRLNDWPFIFDIWAESEIKYKCKVCYSTTITILCFADYLPWRYCISPIISGLKDSVFSNHFPRNSLVQGVGPSHPFQRFSSESNVKIVECYFLLNYTYSKHKSLNFWDVIVQSSIGLNFFSENVSFIRGSLKILILVFDPKIGPHHFWR